MRKNIIEIGGKLKKITLRLFSCELFVIFDKIV